MNPIKPNVPVKISKNILMNFNAYPSSYPGCAKLARDTKAVYRRA